MLIFRVTVGPLMETIRKALAATNPVSFTSVVVISSVFWLKFVLLSLEIQTELKVDILSL